MIRIAGVCCSIFLFLISCHTPSSVKKTVAVPGKSASASSGAIIDSMKSKAFLFDWFSGKSKISYSHSKDKMEVTASFRMKNDSAIWISISPALGLEVARILLTKDSIRVIDRLNNKYFSRDYDFFKSYTSLPISYETIQDLIVGKPLFTDDKHFNLLKRDSTYEFKSEDDTLSNSFVLTGNYLISNQNIRADASKAISILLEKYDQQYTSPFSLWRKIELFNPERTEIVVTFSKININEPVPLPFNAPGQ
ncbi:MAG: DUF4292 domain-containing protein [Chitinophagales bacterium]|nr:DUF4292 domain-containing protein [Chitinophagales bacterium]